MRLGEFKEGDLAVYVPITAVVPADEPRWQFLLKPGEIAPLRNDGVPGIEIEAKKLRGIFSMGLLAAAEPGWEEGRDVAAELRITRSEPPEPTEGNEQDPGLMPVYTDLAALRAYPNVLRDGEEVVITEKIHGECARYVFGKGRLYCGSRTSWKSPDGGPAGGAPGAPLREHAWWEVARRLGLEERLRARQDIGVFGEVYGDARGMKYDARSDARGLRLFDAMSLSKRAYLDHDEFYEVARELGLPMAPVLYRGPWENDLRGLAEGNSVIAQHVREGIVIKPVHERFDERVGRVILKLHGQGFHLRGRK
jgi:RNA ligase (TIGR02306 family)